jgi:hypothetical protein
MVAQSFETSRTRCPGIKRQITEDSNPQYLLQLINPIWNDILRQQPAERTDSRTSTVSNCSCIQGSRGSKEEPGSYVRPEWDTSSRQRIANLRGITMKTWTEWTNNLERSWAKWANNPAVSDRRRIHITWTDYIKNWQRQSVQTCGPLIKKTRPALRIKSNNVIKHYSVHRVWS